MTTKQLFATTGTRVSFRLTQNDYDDLMNYDKAGKPRLEIPEKGPWAKAIRELQDSVVTEADGSRFAAALDTDLHKWCLWWTRGSDGRCGVGGWQQQFPFDSIRRCYEASGSAQFPTVAALFDGVPDEPIDPTIVPKTDRLMTSTEVANQLGASAQRIVALAKAGAIDFERTGTGIYIFRASEVERFSTEQWPTLSRRLVAAK